MAGNAALFCSDGAGLVFYTAARYYENGEYFRAWDDPQRAGGGYYFDAARPEPGPPPEEYGSPEEFEWPEA